MANDRSAFIKIGDEEYELLLTTRATKEIAKRYGGLDKLGDKRASLNQWCKDKLVEHKEYIKEYGDDLPEVKEWTWYKSMNK